MQNKAEWCQQTFGGRAIYCVVTANKTVWNFKSKTKIEAGGKSGGAPFYLPRDIAYKHRPAWLLLTQFVFASTRRQGLE